jgi:hypothetical protein
MPNTFGDHEGNGKQYLERMCDKYHSPREEYLQQVGCFGANVMRLRPLIKMSGVSPKVVSEKH